MTTFRKLINDIDFSNTRIFSTVDWERISNELGVNEISWSEDERLKAYFIKTWYCTDSWVGIRAYFLDKEFVALSFQNGRKSGEEFNFITDEKAEELKIYLRSLVVKQEDSLNVEILNGLDDEISDFYKIEYNSQIIHKTALYEGKEVKILKSNYPWGTDDYFHSVLIEIRKGLQRKVSCKELDFKYNTID